MLGLKLSKFTPVISQVGKQRVAAPVLSTRRFGSTENHQENSEKDYQYEEGFDSKWWKRSFLVIGGIYAWSKFDAYFFSEGEHPLTRFIEYHQETEEYSLKKQVALLKSAQERARVRLLTLEPKEIGFKRICTPDLFVRASPHGIIPGSQTDLSDLEIRF